MSENQISILRPFGPSIAKVKLPNELIDSLNDYIDKTILDEEKIKQLDHGDKLEGNVKQEFKLEETQQLIGLQQTRFWHRANSPWKQTAER